MDKSQIKAVIEKAFSNVTLDGGISILQTQAADKYRGGATDQEYAKLPSKEITHDWKKLSVKDLDNCAIGHLDSKGLRYYLPALMCSLLDNYDAGSMRVIGTISSLYPRQYDGAAEHETISRYLALNQRQCEAIALFLYWMPNTVSLGEEDRKCVVRAIRNYWKSYLPG